MKNKVIYYFDYIIPVYFLINIVSNIISYYLTGNEFDIVRKITSWVVVLLFNILAYFVFLYLWREHKENRKAMCFLAIPVFMFFALITWAIFTTGFSTYAIKEWICFVLYCGPSYIVALYLVMENKIRLLIYNFKWLGLVTSPFFLHYNIRTIIFAVTNEYTDQFAGVIYLIIGYSALIILSFCLLDLFIIVICQERKCYKQNVRINLWNIILCSITIAAAGSRGALASLLVCYLLVLFAMFVKRCKDKTLTTALLFIPIFIILTVFVMENANQGASRVVGFMKEIKSNEINKAMTSEESGKVLEQIKQGSDNGKKISETLSEIEIEDEQTNNAVKSITNGGMARVYLYKLAIREARNHYLTGLGPLGYQMKYGMYPHNIILESLSDLGYPITIIFVIFIFYLIKILFGYSKNNNCLLSVLIISITQGAGMMLSGDLYVQPYLIWIITLVLALKVMKSSLEAGGFGNEYYCNRSEGIYR